MDKAFMRPKPTPPPKPAIRLSDHNCPDIKDEVSDVERPVSSKVRGPSSVLLSSKHIYNKLSENNNNEDIPPMLNNKTDEKARHLGDGGSRRRSNEPTSALPSPKPALLPKPQTPASKIVFSQPPKTPNLRPPVPRRPDSSCLPDKKSLDPDPLKKESPKSKPLTLWSGGGIGSRRNAKFPTLALKAPVAKLEEFDGWLSSPSPVRPPRSPKMKLFLEGPFDNSDEKPELPVKKRLLSTGNDGKSWEVAKKRSSSLGRSGNNNFLPADGKSGSLGRNLSLMDATRVSGLGPVPPPRRRNKSEEMPRPNLCPQSSRSDSNIDNGSNAPIYAQVNYEMKKNRRLKVDHDLPQGPQETQTVGFNRGGEEELVIEGPLRLTGNSELPNNRITLIEPPSRLGVKEAAESKEQLQETCAFDGNTSNFSASLDSHSSGNIRIPVLSDIVFLEDDTLSGNVIENSPSTKDVDSSMSLKTYAFNSDLSSEVDTAVSSKLPENLSLVGSDAAIDAIAPIASQLHRIVSQQSVYDKVEEAIKESTFISIDVRSKPDGNHSQLYRLTGSDKPIPPGPSQSLELHTNVEADEERFQKETISDQCLNELAPTEVTSLFGVCEQVVQTTSRTEPHVHDMNVLENERPVSIPVIPDISGLVISEPMPESVTKVLFTHPSLPVGSPAGPRLWRRQSWSSSKDTTPSPERGLSSSVRKPKYHRQAAWCDDGELSNGALADSDTSGSDNITKLSLGDVSPARNKLTAWFDSFGKGGKKRSKDRKQRTSSFFDGDEILLGGGTDESPKLHVSRPAPPIPVGSAKDAADESTKVFVLESVPPIPSKPTKDVTNQVPNEHVPEPAKDEVDSTPKTDPSFLDGTFKDSESDNEEESRDALDHRTEPEEHRKEKKVFYIAQELVTSEKEFVGNLKLLNVQFLEAVNTAAGGEQNPVIPKTDFSKIINTLPQLQELNEDLLRDLENRIENWSSFPKIADVIVKKGPFLKLYSSYIQNFESQCNYLDDCCQKYSRFARVVKEFEASPSCRKLNIKHFMLKPVQRIPQYRLLLEDYLRNLDADSLDFRDTEEALRIIRDVADHANRSVRMGDQPSKLIELQSQLSNYEIIKPGRQFVKDGELFKLSRKGRHPRYFILLNDCLLYTSKSNTSLIRVNNELPLNGMKVCLPKAEGYQSEFSIISITRSFTLSASSADECQEWINALQNAIKDHAERQLSFQNIKLSPKNVPNQEDVQPFILGHQAPVWIQDGRVTMCQSCTTPFTVMFRRHHCRACGKVVCSVCSDNRAPLRYMGFQAARVCEECHDALLQEFEDPKTKSETNLKDVKEASEAMRSLFKKSGAGGKKKIMLLKKEIPQRLKEVAANDSGSQMSGWLQRRGRRSWKRLWFVLKEQVLYVYKASEDVVALESIPVLGYKVEPMTERHFQIYEGIDARLVFQLAHSGQLPLVFHVESEHMANRWMQAMQEATVLK